MKDIKAVIFDVDETLTDRISWYELTRGLGADPEEHRRILEAMRSGQITLQQAQDELAGLWIATGNATKEYMSQMFESWTIKDQASEIMEYISRKYKVCLISGAVDLYVKSVANKLGIESYYANTALIWKYDTLSNFIYHPDQAVKKLEHLSEYLKSENLQLNDCLVIGDGESDVELFKHVPNSLAITTDENSPILKTATYRINTLLEIKNFI
ncbi:MAG: HAD-IB family phosphatase [bacterium]|nr:HAD-IB family phosphatase [bacterium]